MKNKLSEDLETILGDMTITQFKMEAVEKVETEGLIDVTIMLVGTVDEREEKENGTS
jgi:hypothetical protein